MIGLNDLNQMLENHSILLKNYIQERDRIIESSAPSGYGHGTSYVDADRIRGTAQVDFLDVADKIQVLKEKIEFEQKVISSITKDIEKLTVNTNNLSDTTSRIFEKRYVQGKSLKQIAEEENYSYEYIRTLFTRIRRKQNVV